LTGLVWGLLAVLVLWAGIAALRRTREALADDSAGARARQMDEGRTKLADDDEPIDWETLEQAEREVRELDANQRPEDGFEGDDWGPGGPRPPHA
jgi:hypothetical protein